ncbi:HD domain-containing protein [Aureibacter tunicatorum]|uniref:Metal-dependent HD superfamily phosphohydrolase n=1 Tax=Aureibacter tunicatorum TaxID=866807 RepID=A0AAE3XMM0_9BACT|nr:hypothetical protein [Aureibacter tunicatorum]MDR6238561.1 putative metal-dependent HD superfamily phosphohydrolase [Aureibacter tunicatorum]BDD05508.1 hypothetical protein AUTU_29910 [Aureibacter tunicatorum]
MDNLKGIWTELASRYSNDENLISDLWSEIESHYNKKDRFYHNTEHIKSMIQLAFEYQVKIEDFDTLLFSVFYHDIVYNSSRSDNEKKSALVASQNLERLGVNAEKTSKCYNQIIDTKKHENDTENDIKYLLDFDLAILGSSWSDYSIYMKNIRKEYTLYPDFIYNKGRKQVLKSFLELPQIYKTTEFQNKHEEQAIQNITKEIELL